jgi:hypothetical protein
VEFIAVAVTTYLDTNLTKTALHFFCKYRVYEDRDR